jgi:hypothetical protein
MDYWVGGSNEGRESVGFILMSKFTSSDYLALDEKLCQGWPRFCHVAPSRGAKIAPNHSANSGQTLGNKPLVAV